MTRPATAPPGTCKLTSCKGWGTFDEHAALTAEQVTRRPIGAPDTFEPYERPAGRGGTVVVDRDLLIRCDSFLSALLAGRVVPGRAMSADDREEAAILSGRCRAASQ